jgi:xanthine dehydrogenase accessory factor
VRAGALVVVRGGGDLGTGVAHRLVRARYGVIVLEADAPTAVRRLVAFGEAVRERSAIVEGIEARLVDRDDLEVFRPDARPSGSGWPGWVPVVVDPEGSALERLCPDAIVDARMAKRNLGTSQNDAPVTIGLGPGFTAGVDVDLVIETKRGHFLGRVIESGPALPDTGVPGRVGGAGEERVLRSPAGGAFESASAIGDLVEEGDRVGSVAGKPIRARIAGVVRGLTADGAVVARGDKVGDVDPRGAEVDPRAISDKARAIGGAVLEALLSRGVLPSPVSGEAD